MELNIPEILAVLLVVAVFAFGGIRIGLRFLIRRLAGLVFVLFGVSFITFILGYVTPGTPVDLSVSRNVRRRSIAALHQFYRLDLPWYHQYWNFLTNLLHFNLGLSFAVRGRKVSDVLGSVACPFQRSLA